MHSPCFSILLGVLHSDPFLYILLIRFTLLIILILLTLLHLSMATTPDNTISLKAAIGFTGRFSFATLGSLRNPGGSYFF